MGRGGYIIFIFLIASTLCFSQGRGTDYSLTKGNLIEDIMFEYYDQLGFNGSVLVSLKGDVIYQNTFGLSNYELEEPLDGKASFYLASIGKQFTAAAVLKLVEDGKIKLDDPIRMYLTQLPDLYDPITVHHLLTHTAGVPDYLNEFGKPPKGTTNQDVYKLLINQRSLMFKPGSRFRYSNSGYVLLAMIIEVAAGSTISNYLDSNIFVPFEMDNTFVMQAYNKDIERVIGYTDKFKINDYNLLTVGDGGIYSSASDLFKWTEALNSGEFISEESLRALYTPVTLTSGRKRRYGYGWEIGNNANGKLVYHSGELSGFRTYLESQLETESTIVILTNNSFEEIDELRNTLVKVMDGRLREVPNVKD